MSGENGDHPGRWSDDDWEPLMLAIRAGQCTPFLGAGACVPTLPTGRAVAREWAAKYEYPFEDADNLVRVAQYLNVTKNDGLFPKLKMLERLRGCGQPDTSDPDEPHRVIAELPVPVYITTNYDDFIYRALVQSPSKREPRREVCRWYSADAVQSRRTKAHVTASVATPLVFHMHGWLDEPASMVLTEDDYIDFLMVLSEQEDLIPARVRQALSFSAVLFMGYSLEDTNFKVIFRRLAKYIRRGEGARHVAVQLAPVANQTTAAAKREIERQRRYLSDQLESQKVKVYWGDCRTFARELRERWSSNG